MTFPQLYSSRLPYQPPDTVFQVFLERRVRDESPCAPGGLQSGSGVAEPVLGILGSFDPGFPARGQS